QIKRSMVSRHSSPPDRLLILAQQRLPCRYDDRFLTQQAAGGCATGYTAHEATIHTRLFCYK
ncbi:hypothetical protein, partial [Escherichia coli]|uniref:hypothetical protein n=1 Tax=Escherichia coli TaxID=562 RepID=UPI001BC8ACCB